MIESPDSRKFRRKRCLNCDALFSAEGKTVQQLGKWKHQKFCSSSCRAEYHALLGGKKIHGIVVKLVQAEMKRLLPQLLEQQIRHGALVAPTGIRKSA